MAQDDQMHGEDRHPVRRIPSEPEPPLMGNVNKATAVGVGAGGTGAIVIAYVSTLVEARYGVPLAVTAGVLGTTAGYLARWAAKLLPDV